MFQTENWQNVRGEKKYLPCIGGFTNPISSLGLLPFLGLYRHPHMWLCLLRSQQLKIQEEWLHEYTARSKFGKNEMFEKENLQNVMGKKKLNVFTLQGGRRWGEVLQNQCALGPSSCTLL